MENKVRKFQLSLILFMVCVTSAGLFAQVDTIRVVDKRLNTKILKPGLNQYLVYFQNARSTKSLFFSLWLRDIAVITRNGTKAISITQHWFSQDTASYRYVYSILGFDDFSPIFHRETIGTKTRAFNWQHHTITGADSVEDNLQHEFSLEFKAPCFNWNLDIETFEMLPLASGKTFALPFYDAGLKEPVYALYKVTGSEVLATLNNDKVACWKLVYESDYKGKHATQTFWISKKGHEFLKEEDVFNGGYRYKVKLPTLSTSVLERFIQ